MTKKKTENAANDEETEKRMGRPPADLGDIPKLELVEKLARIQCTLEEIAAIVECDRHTLSDNERFAAAVKKGRDGGKASLRRLQWRAAEKGNAVMLIWLGKNYLGQRDVVEIDDRIGIAAKHAELIRSKREARLRELAKQDEVAH